MVKDVKTKAELDEALLGPAPVVVHFWASWCAASKQMDEVFAHLATDFPHALFLRVSFPPLSVPHLYPSLQFSRKHPIFDCIGLGFWIVRFLDDEILGFS